MSDYSIREIVCTDTWTDIQLLLHNKVVVVANSYRAGDCEMRSRKLASIERFKELLELEGITSLAGWKKLVSSNKYPRIVCNTVAAFCVADPTFLQG